MEISSQIICALRAPKRIKLGEIIYSWQLYAYINFEPSLKKLANFVSYAHTQQQQNQKAKTGHALSNEPVAHALDPLQYIFYIYILTHG